MGKNPIALNIRRLRQSRHWSQEELAAASGADVRTIQRAESGRPLALESLKALAAVFDTTIDALSSSPEDVTRLLDEFREKYSLIELHTLQAAADLQTFLPQADAFLLQRIGTMSDEQADEVAIFEQELKDYGDLWCELEPAQRREAERHFQPMIERLRSLDLSVSLGIGVMNVRLQTGGSSVRFSTLYVAVVPGSTALRFLAREKGQPVQFA